MPLSIGIVGLPNVGKSTLFKTITKKEVPCENYPFCTIDPNVGVVAMPDTRVDKLAQLTHSAKKIYATVDFVDIAGLVKGASKGEGLGNQFLSHIRETDAIVYVLRAFSNENIINTQETTDVLRDKEILDTELILKDLETLEKRITASQREVKAGKREAQKELAVFEKAKDLLDKGVILSEADLADDEKAILQNLCLLTLKQRLYLLNGSESDVPQKIKDLFEKNNWHYLILDVLTEFEAVDMNAEERLSFGLPAESGLNVLIKKCYDILGLITFLTTGPDETRAWTIEKGDKAPQAGRAIHSDFEEFFIKAEVINWQDLLNSNGYARAREKGILRTEGKEYLVCDGDVIEIKSGR